MPNYSDMSNNMEDVRGYFRRLGRHENTEFSKESILSAISDLVRDISTMDETILVPCRLMDLKVGDEQDPTQKKHNAKTNKGTTQDILAQADLFDVYNMLNGIKTDLLWSQNMDETTTASSTPTPAPTTTITVTNASNATQNQLSAPGVKGHIRRPSTVSVASTNSSTSMISDSESDASVENDSGIEENLQVQDETVLLAQNFRRHLKGLTRCLRQMSDAAQYLTSRYQHDIGSPL